MFRLRFATVGNRAAKKAVRILLCFGTATVTVRYGHITAEVGYGCGTVKVRYGHGSGRTQARP